MGLNLMSGSRRVQVMEQARKSTARELHRLRGTSLLPARRPRGRAAAAEQARRARLSAQHFGPTFSSRSATLARCEIEMLRWLDCVQRSPRRSQLAQNSPRMSAERLLKKYRG